MPKKIRKYLMAKLSNRRVPIRIPKAKSSDIMRTATEWWEVLAPSAQAARQLCLRWPMQVIDGESIIVGHGRKRT